MPRIIAIAGLCLLASAGAVSADQAPVPLRPSSGYRDYCDGAKKGPCPRGSVPRNLWRPLVLPTVRAGEACPVSMPHTITRRIPPVLGSGPVYLVAGAYNPSMRSTMLMPHPAPSSSPAAGTGWTLAKAPIVMRGTLRQPLLLRGHQLDGSGKLGFSGYVGRYPYAAMQFPPVGYKIEVGRYKAHSLNIWAATAGCYGLQIDGKSFSRVVVFEVAFHAP